VLTVEHQTACHSRRAPKLRAKLGAEASAASELRGHDAGQGDVVEHGPRLGKKLHDELKGEERNGWGASWGGSRLHAGMNRQCNGASREKERGHAMGAR
jgi:hypothetical protein